MNLYLSAILLPIALLVSGCDVVKRSDTPVSVATVKKDLDLTLPPSAHDIYYFFRAGGLQSLDEYIRFEVPPADLDSAVDTVIANHNRLMSASRPYPKSPLAAGARLMGTDPTMPWWDPHTVKTGYYRGYFEGYTLQMIVDEDRSRIYIRIHD